MTLDTVLALFSTTKALTGTCAMQLVEERKVKLDDAAKKYLPEIAELQVLEGFDANGKPQTRPPKRDITINDLMLHTSGLCYEFFSSDELKYRTEKGIASVVSCTFASIRTVLLHDPGARWTYGPNIDWLGRIVEQQRGKRLGDVMKERVFAPLGMSDIGFTMSESMKARSWAYTFMVNDEEAPTGRPAGSLMWAGLANTFFWIDRKNGIGGYWGSQILPFQDIASYTGFVDFEAAVYRSLKS
jgi:CubicO group peptidase (beta-lactamase class C family)